MTGINQIAVVLGMTCILSIMLHRVSKYRRSTGCGLLGDLYLRLVAPGVACHELGHALGCWITGVPVRKIVFFTLKEKSEGRIGYIVHNSPDGMRFSSMRQFIISTSPVWFGTLVISLLAVATIDGTNLPRSMTHMMQDVPLQFGAYFGTVFASLPALIGLCAEADWFSARKVVALYLMFCISSEMGMSSTDLKGTWKFLAEFIICILLMNMIPIVSEMLSKGFAFVAPFMLVIHLMMSLALFANVAFLLVPKVAVVAIRRICRQKLQENKNG